MVASQKVMMDSAATTAMDVVSQMEALAASGDWDQVADASERLRVAVLNVPEAERRAVLLVAQECTDKVLAEARLAYDSVSGKISELRLGQVAKKAYELR
jgi:hypothetical protein